MSFWSGKVNGYPNLSDKPVDLPLCPLFLVSGVNDDVFSLVVGRVVGSSHNDSITVCTTSVPIYSGQGFQFLYSVHNDAMDHSKLPLGIVSKYFFCNINCLKVTYGSGAVRIPIPRALGRFTPPDSYRLRSRCFKYGELPRPPDKTR
jgi:hypothetical protein